MLRPAASWLRLGSSGVLRPLNRPERLFYPLLPTPPPPSLQSTQTEMGYEATGESPAGEVLLRGPVMFSGYYKQQDKTDEVCV